MWLNIECFGCLLASRRRSPSPRCCASELRDGLVGWFKDSVWLRVLGLGVRVSGFRVLGLKGATVMQEKRGLEGYYGGV